MLNVAASPSRVLTHSPPVFIPSLSGAAKTHLHWRAPLRALVEWRAPSLLISAYDLHHLETSARRSARNLLEQAFESGQLIILDSGGYEARWMRDDEWNIDAFHEVVLDTPHTAAFTFDSHEIDPVESLDTTAEFLGSEDALIPIVHGTTPQVLKDIEAIVPRSVPAIAVTERDLGDGIDDVATSLREIVAAASDKRKALHVLGAGNPLAILLYTWCGASSFDGLDWCQTVADPKTATMHHSKHLPLYAGAEEPVDHGNYYLRMLAHNLTFFDTWTARISEALAEDQMSDLIEEYLPVLDRSKGLL